MPSTPPLAGEAKAAPAAASNGGVEEWGGVDGPNDGASQLSTLPLLM